jgi:hypothetical protein
MNEWPSASSCLPRAAPHPSQIAPSAGAHPGRLGLLMCQTPSLELMCDPTGRADHKSDERFTGTTRTQAQPCDALTASSTPAVRDPLHAFLFSIHCFHFPFSPYLFFILLSSKPIPSYFNSFIPLPIHYNHPKNKHTKNQNQKTPHPNTPQKKTEQPPTPNPKTPNTQTPQHLPIPQSKPYTPTLYNYNDNKTKRHNNY